MTPNASRRTIRSKRGLKGQALVEFALLTPVLLLFVLLTVDVGRAFWESIDAAGAARAGVRSSPRGPHGTPAGAEEPEVVEIRNKPLV